MGGALGLVITTDVPIEGRHAQPVYVDDSLPIVGPSRACVVITGEIPPAGGPPIPVRLAPAGTPAIGPAIPVYVVSGSLSSGTAPANTVLPAISGTLAPGQLLTTTDGTWTGTPAPTFTYQWKRGGVDIGGATANTYTVVAADAGTTLTVTVTATNVAGSASATSAGVAVSSLHSALSVFYKLADLTDSTANALTLTNNNAATFVPGKIGDAVNLVRASTQYLSRAHNVLLRPDATNGFTIACWFNRANASAVHNLVAKGAFASNNTEYVLFCSNVVNRVECFVGNGAALANPNISTGIGALGTWNLIILKSDCTTVSLRLNNGTPVTAALAGVVSGGSGAFNIGAASGVNTLDGLGDAVGFWQRALTSAEEAALWNGGAGIEWPF